MLTAGLREHEQYLNKNKTENSDAVPGFELCTDAHCAHAVTKSPARLIVRGSSVE
jgi:hypothetical protein